MARPGPKPRPPLTDADAPTLACTGIVQELLPLRDWMVERQAAGAMPADHGNTVLRQVDLLLVLLAGFFNPAVRSLRLIEQFSQLSWVRRHTPIERACRSTVSDALARFDPAHLVPLIDRLSAQLPPLAAAGAVSAELRDLVGTCRQIIAADGSTFTAAADVAWALNLGGRPPKGKGKDKDGAGADANAGAGANAGGDPGDAATARRPAGAGGRCVRLNLQLDVDAFAPAAASVSGGDEGSEAAAFADEVRAGVLYLVDRGFVHFGFLNAVLDAGSEFVARLEADTIFNAAADDAAAGVAGAGAGGGRPLTPRDVAAGVVSDRLGTLGGPRGGRTGPAPARVLREVVVVTPAGQRVRLLTSLLDAPAWAIADLYRLRWQVDVCHPYCLHCHTFDESSGQGLGRVSSAA